MKRTLLPRPHQPGFQTAKSIRRGRIWLYTRLVRGSFRSCGPAVSISPLSELLSPHNITIGRNVVIGPDCILRSIGGGKGQIAIGDGVSMVGWCSVSAVQRVDIEAHAMFARGIYIADHNHAFDDPSSPVRDQGVKDVAPVRIGRGCWLGENVVVGPGVTIGEGAVVAAHSLVRHDVPPFSLAAGAPAKIIRSWGNSAPGTA